MKSNTTKKHLQRRGKSAQQKKATIDTLAEILAPNSSSEPEKLKRFIDIFKSNEKLLRTPRENFFSAIIKKMIRFLFPFPFIQKRLNEVAGAHLADRINAVISIHEQLDTKISDSPTKKMMQVILSTPAQPLPKQEPPQSYKSKDEVVNELEPDNPPIQPIIPCELRPMW